MSEKQIASLLQVITSHSGQLLVELLIVMGILAITLPALTSAILTSRSGELQQQKRVLAIGLYKEALEAVRVSRENDWNTFAINGTYHPEVVNSTWELAADPETIQGQTRSIVISDAQRDQTGALVDLGGNVDPSTKKVQINITWSLPTPDSFVTDFYVTRYLDNLSLTDTLEPDFDGITAGTAVTNLNGGAVQLGSGGAGSWCEPFSSEVAQLDLPKSGVANAISADVISDEQNRIYVGTGENASGVAFANITVSNDQPPALTIAGVLEKYKTNDVFGDDQYAYIATDTNDKEIIIIDLSSLPYQVVGSVNLPGTTDPTSVVVIGQIGYAVSGNKLYNFDLSSKTGERLLLDSDGATLPGNGTALEVVGDYAYVSIANSSTKLQIIDISLPNDLQLKGTFSAGNQNATDVSVNQTGTWAYLAMAAADPGSEVYLIDVSTKTGNLPLLGDYNTGEMSPKTISVVTGNVVIVAGSGGQEYQVINVNSDGSSLTQCGGLEIPDSVNDLATVLESDGDAYTYVLTGASNNELRVFQGGPGGQYSSEGTYESAAFDANRTTAFNYVTATLVTPNNQTTAQYQVAMADAVDNSCELANYFFVGPDGTSNSFYTSEGPIPLNDDGMGYENPGRCMKYKLFFTTNDFSNTPYLEDITINYSP